ncbi:MAG: hypothetical protein H7Z71_08320 [Moraxellaceae bacterium]|nr:hypothetical protein [Pseudobdellovibrionaceae bacterium]
MKKSEYLIQASLSCILFLTSCGKLQVKESAPVSEIKVEIAEVKANISDFEPLAWETKKKSGTAWSKMIYSVIENEEDSILADGAAEDILIFCPRYATLKPAQRLNFWGQFFVALAVPESGWDPAQTTLEPDKKFKNLDSVTRKPVRSEGLLQLSYQDEKNLRLNCGFNWNRDQSLAPEDSRKTIFHPYLNLRCGIKIMSRQLKNRKSITLKDNVYWSVLRTTDNQDKIDQIATMTKSLKMCR